MNRSRLGDANPIWGEQHTGGGERESRKERKEEEKEGKYRNYNSWMTEGNVHAVHSAVFLGELNEELVPSGTSDRNWTDKALAQNLCLQITPPTPESAANLAGMDWSNKTNENQLEEATNSCKIFRENHGIEDLIRFPNPVF
ncbi:hypothetical protein DUI87_08562 [Hirundo rustica rustica]|uniref:Uncharacterized protein n=1 Tax=Hirundo rustica rustica TaxID=333673 RepID=A0A3M0KJQ6_HIRRU|nr:hypothetical protein DUI87_08562 [Hirundo rustica rustica]